MVYRRLTGAFILEGAGLHSGENCRLKISPLNNDNKDENSEKTGIFFKVKDNLCAIENLGLQGGGRGSDYIFNEKLKVRTCEHVLSGLAGMGVWSAELEFLDCGKAAFSVHNEAPALDGCAGQVCEKILKNSEFYNYNIEPLKLYAPVYVRDLNNQDRFIAAFPDSNLHITCAVSYNTPVINSQILDFNFTPDFYYNEIARARTFAMRSEIEFLRANGMALGGSLDNAILVGDKDKDDFQALNGLRWPDEFVRHKSLDLIGDLAALGRPLNAHIITVKAGHELHLKLVEKLRKLLKK